MTAISIGAIAEAAKLMEEAMPGPDPGNKSSNARAFLRKEMNALLEEAETKSSDKEMHFYFRCCALYASNLAILVNSDVTLDLGQEAYISNHIRRACTDVDEPPIVDPAFLAAMNTFRG